jgi:SOUL heme-binding protein
MPSSYSINNLPEPSDPRVKLIELEPMTAAVLQFSGSTSDAVVSTRTTELMTAIQNTKWRVSGAATAFFYNPPWTLPFLRRNEMAVPVSK